MIGVSVLGATGSIGCSTLEVLRLHPERYRAVALTANRDVDNLFRQCVEFSPDFAVMADASAASLLRERLASVGSKTEVLEGEEGLEAVASLPEVDAVMAAIVGAAGLMPALAAVRAGKRVLLANKEALVVSGQLFMDEVKRCGAEVLPIDSEHNAVFQCMPSTYRDGLDRVGVKSILLTASGGPFRAASLEDLQDVTPEQACNHPNWAMGPKISVDSATMMNKGLEVIEARWLFDTSPDNIRVVVHPQSVIHSMVEYVDGSILAQMGNPDMRTPIAHALGWPERIQSGVDGLNLFEVARLDFQPPDFERFPCLRLAYAAIREGGAAPAVLNAANEVAVAAFLAGELGFMRIAEVVERSMEGIEAGAIGSLEEVLDVDRRARAWAEQTIAALV